MARTLNDIQTDTFNAMLQQPTMVSTFNLDPTKTYDQQNKSVTALWFLIMWIGCSIAWVLETLFYKRKLADYNYKNEIKVGTCNFVINEAEEIIRLFDESNKTHS